MTEEWKPGDRVQLTGTVEFAHDSGSVNVLFDGGAVTHIIGPAALAAGKRLPRALGVGDEVLWSSSNPESRRWSISSIDGEFAVVRGPGSAWRAPLSELRPAPVKP